MITIKTPSEIELMARAGEVVEKTLLLLKDSAKVGMTTAELDEIAHAFIISQGAKPSFLNYEGYPKSICTSVNEQVVHGIPGKYRLKDGDLLSVDVGAVLNGWQGDAARSIIVGTAKPEWADLVRVTRECFFEGIKFARVGYRLSDIAKAIEEHATAHGYGVVHELVGHGIGTHMHEPPEVPNYYSPRFGLGPKLVEGMTIAIEPMITLGKRYVVTNADEWTVVTKDGMPSSHYENTIAITAGEPRILTMTLEDMNEQHL